VLCGSEQLACPQGTLCSVCQPSCPLLIPIIQSTLYRTKVDNGCFVLFAYTSNIFASWHTHYTAPDLADTFDIDATWLECHEIGIVGQAHPHQHLRKLYMAIPVNILLWGCDSWALSSSHFKKLAAFHNRCAPNQQNHLWHCQHYHILMQDMFKNV
jgi:hypothetical protein